jgi:hypothetical protein
MSYKLAVLGVTALLVAMSPGLGSATVVPPSASLKPVDIRITAGTSPSFRFTVRAIPPGGRAYLEQVEGTASVWRTVAAIRSGTGVVTGPKLPEGKYLFRVAIVSGHQTLAASRTQVAFSYGTVLMSTITGSGTNVVQIGSQLFSYEASDNPGTLIGSYNTLVSEKSTTCRSISVQIGALNLYDGSGGEASVSVVQENTNPQATSTYPGTVGSLQATLTGGPWTLEDTTTVEGTPNPSSDHEPESIAIYVSGMLSCYTPTGSRTSSN